MPPDTTLDARLLAYLQAHTCKSAPASRETLIEEAGLFGEDDHRKPSTKDRRVREAIERLHRAGYVIPNVGDGYFLATGEEAAEGVRAIVDGLRRRVRSMCITVALLARHYPAVVGLQVILKWADGSEETYGGEAATGQQPPLRAA